MIELLINIIQVIGITFIFNMLAYAMFKVSLYAFTGINFEKSLFNANSNNTNNISNKIASTIIASFF